MTKYEVQEYCLCGGWTNTWRHTQDDSDEPVYFNSREGAQLELDNFIQDLTKEVEAGNMTDVPDLDSFRIVEIPVTYDDLKDHASRLGYELSDEDCADIIATSYDGETAKEAVNDFLNAFER